MTKHSWTISSSPSDMAKNFSPNSTINPTKLGGCNLSSLEPLMIVPYWRRRLVPTRFFRRLNYYILNIPLHRHGMRKRNFISTSIYLSVCLNSFPEEFQIRGTDETLMVETAVCPNNIFNDSFLCISTLLITKFAKQIHYYSRSALRASETSPVQSGNKIGKEFA